MAALELPALRVWQLSQSALSGMLAGLLKQPRRRPRGGAMMKPDPESDPVVLRKRILQLEKELVVARKLTEILRDLPGMSRSKAPEATVLEGKKRRRPRGGAPPDRSPAGSRSDPTV
jgi:hypothetical protein